VEEAVLVERLRSEHPAEFGPALVAEVDGQVVGYVCCSQMRIDDAPDVTLLGLGPIAVLPSRQMMGIGSALVRRVKELATVPVALVGEPVWYSRFGFVPAEPLGIRSQWRDMGDEWQIWFPPDVAPERYGGIARYLPPFDEL
jgi:putative acetyltransferase